MCTILGKCSKWVIFPKKETVSGFFDQMIMFSTKKFISIEIVCNGWNIYNFTHYCDISAYLMRSATIIYISIYLIIYNLYSLCLLISILLPPFKFDCPIGWIYVSYIVFKCDYQTFTKGVLYFIVCYSIVYLIT